MTVCWSAGNKLECCLHLPGECPRLFGLPYLYSSTLHTKLGVQPTGLLYDTLKVFKLSLHDLTEKKPVTHEERYAQIRNQTCLSATIVLFRCMML